MPPKRPSVQTAAQPPRPAAGRTTCRPLPGTPVRVGATPKRKSQHTCPICVHPIIEMSANVEGQEAILCEGKCSSWYHRWCAGVTTSRYEELSESEEPFHCPTCTAKQQQQTILDLHCSVQSLQEEVQNLKAAVSAMQEKDSAITTSLTEDVSELKAIVASLQEPGTECANPSASELPDNTQIWSEVVRRKPPHTGGKAKGVKGRTEKGGNEYGRTKERNANNIPGQSKQGGQHENRNAQQFRSLPGKRKVWGTRKACSSDTVKNTITKLTSRKFTIEVKRKYKLVNGNKTVKWWHVLKGEEDVMVLLEKEWSKVKDRTSWSIEPCLAFENNAQTPTPQPDNSPIVSDSSPLPGDGKLHSPHASAQQPTMDTIQSTDASPRSDQNAAGCTDN